MPSPREQRRQVRRRRVQAASDGDLAVRPDVCASEQAPLRAQAHAVNLA